MVLHVRVVVGGGGGADKTVVNSPRFLGNHGYRSTCLFMHAEDDDGFEIIRRRGRDSGARIVSVPDAGPFDIGVISRCLRVCREEKAEIWHAHDYKSNLLGLVLRRFHPMTLVSTVHGWGAREGRAALYHFLDNVCLPRYEMVLCVSADLRETCLAMGVAERKCRLIKNGIDVEQFVRREARSEAKRRMGLPPGRILIGAVGRLSTEKAFDQLILCVDQLVRNGHDVQLILAGEGDQESSLRRLVEKRGLQDRVKLIGFCSDTISLYQAMDIYALSSLREGLPNVVLESMACEVPVVATRIAGLPSLVEHEFNGLLVEPGDQGQMTSALVRLAADCELRDRLAANGRQTIEDSYSFAQRMEKMARLYDELIGRTGRQRVYTRKGSEQC